MTKEVNDKSKKDWDKIIDEEDNQEQDELGIEAEQDGLEHDEAPEALNHPSYKQLEDQLTAAEQQAHENWDKATRALAELDNVRRRAERDVEKAHKFGVEKLIKELIPVLDSLDQALQLPADQAAEALHQGVELTHKLLLDTLQKVGVTEINPVDEAFDPQHHEAMSMQEAPDAKSGSVMMVIQKGYLLHDRVIRPARVIVAK